MTKKIIFVADFFLEQGIQGGAEYCNDELIKMFENDGIQVLKINSQNLNQRLIQKHKDYFFIVANFMLLNEESKTQLKENKYIIYEHDHKYVDTNDPSKFIDMIAPNKNIINKEFYVNALAVFCQSKKHAETLQKNLLINNLVNLGGNVWSDEKLDFLCSLIGTKKTKKNAILYSTNKNKGTQQSIQYCKKNNIDFEFIEPCKYKDFAQQLAATERIIMFPQWLESFNRVIVEGRILGCKFTTNQLIGAVSEPWFKSLKGLELAQFLRKKREEIYQTFINAIENEECPFVDYIDIPKVSIITSLYKGGEYIEHFLSEVSKQTIFDKCELIIIDANSPDQEHLLIEEFCKKHKNVIYKKLNFTPSVQETMNMGVDISSGEFLTLWNVDDTRRPDALEVMAKTLAVDPVASLVYGDSYQTNRKNETFSKNTSNGIVYEHSKKDFSKENMIKCLPGPLPMWKKIMSDDCGRFDEQLKFAGDWDMWLRAVQKGHKFKKVHEVLGLYYFNPAGLSTSREKQEERFNEEKQIFYKYKDVFGPSVYNDYKAYFL